MMRQRATLRLSLLALVVPWLVVGASAGCFSRSRAARAADQADAAIESARARVTVVEIGGGLVGTLVVPTAPGPHPVVLMLHGFGSSRDEVHRMFARTAAALADEGIASLRIDFRGSGDSAGKFQDTTIDTQLADTERALDWLRGQKDIDPARIGLLGFSLGGAIAILTAGRHPYDIQSLVVWSTVGDLRADFLSLLGAETFERARQKGHATHDLGWREVTLGRAFFESLDDHDIATTLVQYNGPFLAIAGTEDPLARHARPLAESVDGMTVMVRDADHVFHSSNPRATPVDTVIQTTTVRFTGTLRWQ